MFISIITPIYNRADLFERVYESLKKQNNKNFEWIIVDDGSSDQLKEKVLSLDEKQFPLHYYYKENGGKHTALNMGFEKAISQWCLILDSDDWLLPTAIDDIYNEINNFSESPSGLVFLKSYKDGQVIGKPIVDYGKLYAPQLISMKGDKAYVVKTELLKKIKFPQFEKEKFVTESYLWNQCFDREENYAIGVNKIIYVAEYLPGGLTDNYYLLLKNSPQGTLDFVISNLTLNYVSLPCYKQAAYHFIPIADKKNLTALYKNIGVTSFCKFIVTLMAMFIKIKMRKK